LLNLPFEEYGQIIKRKKYYTTLGKVTQVIGLIIQVEGLETFIGEVCEVYIKSSGPEKTVLTEVVGFKDTTVLLMPLDDIKGIGPGCLVKPTGRSLKVNISEELLGKTVDGLGRPVDKNGLIKGEAYDIDREPPSPFERRRIEKVMSTGVKAIDGLLTCGEGQRIGIFAGSGVGKSTLLGMLARHCDADVNVIGLIGERGREVIEFIENSLGEEGYKKSSSLCHLRSTTFS